MSGDLRARMLALHRAHIAPYSIVSLDPPIFYVQLHGDGLEQFVDRFHVLFTALRGRPAYCLLCYGFHPGPWAMPAIERLQAQCAARFPDVQLIHLCNEPEQPSPLRARGYQAEFCNQNCLVDEAIFAPNASIAKRFDAVYDARLSAVKRHHLAHDIASLALIYYPFPLDDPTYVQMVHEQLAHAHRFNETADGAFALLSPHDVNRALNACRVGLCLSAEEGSMLASMQYLLSGVPVVTTPSVGGRTVFFTDDCVITAEPDARAIRDAVQVMIDRDLTPERVRASALPLLRQHRQTFMDVVQRLYDTHHVRRTFADEWPRVFFHTMLRNQRHHDTIALLAQADAKAALRS